VTLPSPREVAGLGELAVWLQRQRQLQRRGKLSAKRAKQLEALGVACEPHDVRWRQRSANSRSPVRLGIHRKIPNSPNG
jgi:Helicase associated domain